MSQNNAPHELYIEQVRADENKKRRKYLWLLLLLLLFLGIGGVGVYSLMRHPDGLEYRTFNKTDLDLNKVKGILANKNVRIRVLDYERGRLDTINSIDEYQQLYSNDIDVSVFEYDSMDMNDSLLGEEDNDQRDFANVSPSEESSPEPNERADFYNISQSSSSNRRTNSGPLKNFQLDIIGKRVAGEILSFIITDYNPSIKYNLDFGNGIVQEAKEITLYMYPQAGRFTLNLTATDAQFNRSKTNEKIEIKNGSEPLEITKSTSSRDRKPLSTNEPTASEWEAVQPKENIDTNQKPDVEELEPVEEEIEDTKTPNATEKLDVKPEDDPNEAPIKVPLKTAQKAPSFPGGTKSMYSFLNQYINYPQQARDYEVEGKVYVQFEVGTDGLIKNPSVVKGLGYGCDEEALRIVKLMPGWEPAKHMDKLVPYIYTLPVEFKLID